VLGCFFSYKLILRFCQNYWQRRAKRSSALREKAAELARADCKARKGGTKLRLATCSGTFWLEAQVKLMFFIKLQKQFGLARRSGTFLLDAGAAQRRAYKSSALAECA
jgi:hypothetical protein